MLLYLIFSILSFHILALVGSETHPQSILCWNTTSTIGSIAPSTSLYTHVVLDKRTLLDKCINKSGSGVADLASELLQAPTKHVSLYSKSNQPPLKTTSLSSIEQGESSTLSSSNSISQSVVVLSSTSSIKSASSLDMSTLIVTTQPRTEITQPGGNSRSSQISRGLAAALGTSTVELPTARSTIATVTFDGTTYIINSASLDLTSSLTFHPGGFTTTISNSLTFRTSDNNTYTPNSASDYLIAGQTLVPGGPTIVVSSIPVTLVSGVSALIIGIKVHSLFPTYATSIPHLLTIDHVTYTPNSASVYIIASQTLIPGGQGITVSDVSLSLAPGASDVVVGTSTIAETLGIGGYIWNGIGGSVPNSQPSATGMENATDMGIEPFTGGTRGLSMVIEAWRFSVIFIAIVAYL